MIVGVLQARMSSTRLPGKALAPLCGRPLLERQIERVARVPGVELVVATSDDASDDPVAALCAERGVACFRGDLEDVLDRCYRAAAPHRPDHVLRLTGDCPLADPELIARLIDVHLREDNDYTSNALRRSYPDGLDAEVVRFPCLEQAWREARLAAHREHVTPFLYEQPGRFRIGEVRSDVDLSEHRWTVDRADDLAFVRRVYERLYPETPDFSTADVLALLEREPELAAQSRRGDAASPAGAGSERYRRSEELLRRARRSIPLGSQTFSKSVTHLPLGAAPFFLERGHGSHVFDVDGNEYVDFVNALAAVLLGYGDPDVDAAVREQLGRGVSFSLSTRLEVEVAEALCELVPCAEQVRFGKNGSDATAAAVRLARAHTGRDHVAVCGYHGWQDWYIGSTSRHRGVPEATRALTHGFAYNDLASLERLFERHRGGLAAVMLEPMTDTEPEPGFLEGVAELTRRHGALLVFDETITGLRLARGGAQEAFGVTPDLATLGKGLANGFPLSALVGRAELMRELEEIFFSTTFGGETLSLAAARAVLDKVRREPVVETIAKLGQQLGDGVRDLIARHGSAGWLALSGHPSWTFLHFSDHAGQTSWEIRTLFFQEAFARGILTLGTHNLSYAHSDADVEQLLRVYDEVLPLVGRAAAEGRVRQVLRCEPLEPLFRVR